MPDDRRALVSGAFEKRETSHRVEDALAEVVGKAIVDTRDADTQLRQVQSELRVEVRGTIVATDGAADAKRGATRFRGGMQNHRDGAAGGLNLQPSRAGHLGARVDSRNA